MTHRRLTDAMTVYRIGDPKGEFPVYSAEGARRTNGRWHRVGDAVIYAAEHYSTAMLELLAHSSGRLPPRQHFIAITLPPGTSYEVVTTDSLPGWHRRDQRASRPFGRAWLAEGRSSVLIVPSVVARMERNVVINPAHPDAARIRPDLEQPIWWDERLF